jgi:hypothetical protein
MLKLFYGALHLELLLEVSFKTPFIRLKRCKSRFENAEMQMNLNWIKWIPGGISPAPAPWKCEGFIPCLPPTQCPSDAQHFSNKTQERDTKNDVKMTLQGNKTSGELMKKRSLPRMCTFHLNETVYGITKRTRDNQWHEQYEQTQ